jgi:anti-sigma regulatory factor (Ser/Thr protein kinase)
MRTNLAGNVHAPAEARRFVIATLGRIHQGISSSRGDDVVLVVSELVTNGVRAGASAIDVDLEASADRIELHVTDDAPGWPEPRHAEPDDLAGRGLAIVEDLADDWHTTSLPRGKRVTATWSQVGAGSTC